MTREFSEVPAIGRSRPREELFQQLQLLVPPTKPLKAQHRPVLPGGPRQKGSLWGLGSTQRLAWPREGQLSLQPHAVP
ncbi:rCG52012 [Rattus norvegicus]|uniref:RCG52012 n=1 Tax=Rattus norvegicus TaxID=10116 RepID=A6K2Q4_RAT|nr:rCG52012 [Rattus norvegicus]